MRHRRIRRKPPKPDYSILGGHDFDQVCDHEDDADYIYRCTRCHAVVNGWEIDEGVWHLRAGRYCPAQLMKET